MGYYLTDPECVETLPDLPLDVPIVHVAFDYDYMSRRVGKHVYEWDDASTNWLEQSHSTFLYDGWNLVGSSEISDFQSQTQTNDSWFVWGLDLSGSLQGAGGIGGLLASYTSATSNPVRVYTYDANGNVSELLDPATGAILAHYEYSPFGETIVATGELAKENPYRFSTKYTDDETKLVYYGYRFYSPDLGRWVNRDPIGEYGFFTRYTRGKDRAAIKALTAEGLAPSYLFVYNIPIGRYDVKGLVSPVVVVLPVIAAAATCLYPHFNSGMNRYPDDSAMRHCWTSCAAARTCGTALSAVAGLGFEVVVEGLEEIFPNSTADWRKSIYDLINNAKGLVCAGIESAIVPGLGNITRWFRESCECCCKRNL